MPDIGYYQSLTFELEAIKNRIRHLVTHWQADGELEGGRASNNASSPPSRQCPCRSRFYG